jgi:hypothetical protein
MSIIGTNNGSTLEFDEMPFLDETLWRAGGGVTALAGAETDGRTVGAGAIRGAITGTRIGVMIVIARASKETARPIIRAMELSTVFFIMNPQ